MHNITLRLIALCHRGASAKSEIERKTSGAHIYVVYTAATKTKREKIADEEIS